MSELYTFVVWGESGYIPLVFDISNHEWLGEDLRLDYTVFAGFEPKDICQENIIDDGTALVAMGEDWTIAEAADDIIDTWLYAEDTGYLPDWMKG